MNRVLVILSLHDEHRFVRPQLEHLATQEVDVAIICDRTSDDLLKVVESYRGRGVTEVVHYPRRAYFDWSGILHEKERLAREHPHPWVVVGDIDEFRMSDRPGETLGGLAARIDHEGYNAVNFAEYVFVPTREAPDHDHPDFQTSMTSYYLFQPRPQHRRTMWKNTGQAFNLEASGGHFVDFEGMNIYPHDCPLRHYIYLSPAHFREKYDQRSYDAASVNRGWHGWRATPHAVHVALPSQREFAEYDPDHPFDFDRSVVRTEHLVTKTPPSQKTRSGWKALWSAFRAHRGGP